MQLHPESYYKHSLFLPQIGAVVRNTFSTRRFALSLNGSMLRVSPKDAAAVADKRRFSRRIAQAALPGIKILAEFKHGTAINANE